ncbi:MAG: hypothetical protein ACREP0_10860, partial [Rhodanobacteraceae bacterium]
GLDGITSPIPHASISQTVGGLVAGKQYKVGFYWGNTQLQNRTGTTTEQLQVSLGSQSFSTPISTVLTHAWSGWFYQTFTFTAGSSAGSDLLSFLSIGTPNSLPPFALLAGVTMYAVPEPPVLAMFGGGLLGLGLLTLYTRRRKERREAEA